MIDRSKWCCLGEGPPNAKICLIGEAPGTHESRVGRPFYENAQAGRKLRDVMQLVGLARSQCYITNVLKEHPPFDNIKPWFEIARTGIKVSADFREYVDILRDELLERKDSINVFIPMGNVALYALTGQVKITKRRGSILEGKFWPGMKVIPTIHPSAIAGTDSSKRGEYMYFHYMRMDLRRAVEESQSSKIVLPERNLIINSNFHEVVSFLTNCRSYDLISFDIEVSSTTEEITCISFATSPNEAISINFTSQGNDKFTAEQEARIWSMIGQLLSNPRIRKVGHNIIFDASFLYRKLGIVTVNVDDTMIAMKTTFPDFPMGLDFVTTMFTKEPYYKDEGKKWAKLGNEDEFYIYNAKDSAVAIEILPKLLNDCSKQGNEKTYERQKALIPILTFIQEYGMRVDVEGMKRASQEAEEKIDVLTTELQDICGFKINPNSPQQVMKYLYDTKGHRPYLKDGKPTSNLNTLIRLSRQGVKEADILKQIRKLSKLKGTYYDVNLSEDNRLRSAMSPTAETGRLRSGADIFGRGTNVQNIPESVRKFILVDEGFVGYILDLSQAENRIVANIAPEPMMKKAFDNGTDVHKLTAALCFSIPYDEVSDEEGSSSIGTGEHSQRYWGKKANHEFNYDRGYKSFAVEFEMTEGEGKFIHDRYHQIYPGVRQYHAWIRAQLSKTRTLTNPYGRVRLFLDRWGDELFKAAYAHIPQSTVADKINEDGLIFIYYNQQWFGQVYLLNQIHDAIFLQIPISAGWLYHAECLLRIANKLETPITWRGTTFTIPVDIVMGFSFNKEEGRKVKFHGESVEGLAGRLHGLYKQQRESTQLSPMVSNISDSSLPSA